MLYPSSNHLQTKGISPVVGRCVLGHTGEHRSLWYPGMNSHALCHNPIQRRSLMRYSPTLAKLMGKEDHIQSHMIKKSTG